MIGLNDYFTLGTFIERWLDIYMVYSYQSQHTPIYVVYELYWFMWLLLGKNKPCKLFIGDNLYPADSISSAEPCQIDLIKYSSSLPKHQQKAK